MTDYRGVITGVPERRSGLSEPARADLTTTEAIVLDVILRFGETTLDAVANETGLTTEQLKPALDRLLSVGYVRAVARDGTTLYRGSPRPLQ
jgi:DNA-binding MarR family transcriptional regulator